MSFRSIVRDVRDGFGSMSRRGFSVRLSGQLRDKYQIVEHEEQDQPLIVQDSFWGNIPPELLRDVVKRLEVSENPWPSRQNVIVCAAVCRSWREMCKEIVKSPEFGGSITFPVSLKQPGPRDGLIQCYIKRDKTNLTYELFLSGPDAPALDGKFLLSAKRIRRTTNTEYIISMDNKTISRSSSSYIGKLRSNFLGTKFTIYDTQPPHEGAPLQEVNTSRRFYSRKVSPKVPSGSYNIAKVTYELNVMGTRGPRKMQCIMHSIPASALDTGGIVPGQPESLVSKSLEDSFRRISFSKSTLSERSVGVSSSRFSDIGRGARLVDDKDNGSKGTPLVLKNKVPRWHEQLQCWCLNFRGRVTVASVKNFQLIDASKPAAGTSTPSQPPSSDNDKIILQFGKIAYDTFTMDYCYPLSAFQAFAICLSSFDAKLACE